MLQAKLMRRSDLDLSDESRGRGLAAMRRLGALVAVVLLGLGASACSGAGKRRTASPQAASNAAEPGVSGIDSKSVYRFASGGYLNDGDYDHTGDLDGDNNADVDNDPLWDYKTKPDDNSSYHDADDSSAVPYRHAASRADRQAITVAVKRYYAAMASTDGALACSHLLRSLAKALPLDYGKLGPAYLRGAKTCSAVVVRVAAQSRGQLAAPIAVTDVRVEGGHALALVGSKTMPASSLALERERGVWRIGGLVGNALP
jgi:hypothetical protein